MGKCGQLTIFLLIGLITLFAFAMVYVIGSRLIPEGPVTEVSDDVPPPILSYIKNTLEDAARGAVIETIAPQSGYQDPMSAKNQQPVEFYGKTLEMNFDKEYR